MLLKWIVCQVHSEMKCAFSKAQEQWRSIDGADGFLGQFGGWDTTNERPDACILGLWASRSAYDTFMRQIHDQVTDKNYQEQTYHQITVELFESELPIEGQSGALASAYPKGHFLRVADCKVKENCIDHFIQVQKSIWIPGMRESDGMLGGSFNRSTQVSNRFLVTSIWNGQASHDRYTREKLPRMRLESAVADDTDAVVGRLVTLEESWLIQPKRR